MDLQRSEGKWIPFYMPVSSSLFPKNVIVFYLIPSAVLRAAGLLCFGLFLMTNMSCKFCFAKNFSAFSVWSFHKMRIWRWALAITFIYSKGWKHLACYHPAFCCYLHEPSDFLCSCGEVLLSADLTQRWVVCLVLSLEAVVEPQMEIWFSDSILLPWFEFCS